MNGEWGKRVDIGGRRRGDTKTENDKSGDIAKVIRCEYMKEQYD